jgi:serine phosphatase RsbU (regulator of sigma subunit)
MAGLIAVARALGTATTEQEVADVLTEHVLVVIGAQGVGLVLPQPEVGQVRVLTSTTVPARVRSGQTVLPADFPLPAVHTAVTGTAHFFGDRAEAMAVFPGGRELYERANSQATATVPLTGTSGDVLGALGVAFDRPYPWRPGDRDLLEALAALTTQALERLRALAAERESTRAVSRLAETLQRSLLSAPPQPDQLQIEARYVAAAHEAQIGGDWHDAFVNGEGNTMLVIGDVAGHDRDAAAAMAQTRNVLRGVAQALNQPPAAVLSMLDRAMDRLQMNILATAVLCEIRTAPAGLPGRILRWSNAGHPPLLLIRRDGTTVLLEREPDLLLGLDPDTLRADHDHTLAFGDTVLLYTDGLIERRGEPLDHALTRLRSTARDVAHLPLDAVCDALLTRLGTDAEDDIALIALRPRAPLR